MKKIIISGAGGFVGSELTKKMIENGNEVIAISLNYIPSFPESPLVKKMNIVIENPEKLIDLIPKGEYDAFYHLAWRGVNGPEKANPDVQVDNIKMAMGCARVAKALGCKKYLCSGTVAEKAVESLTQIETTSGGMLYGVAKHCTHLMLETYCKKIGLDFVWMQFSNIYGPQNKTGNLVSYTIGMLSEDKEATFGPALQPYDFIYVDDLIEAVYRLGIEKTNKNSYFIGSGNPRTLRDYLIQIGREYGKPELIKIGLRADDGIRYTKDMFNISDLVKDIGEYISTDFDQGIRITIQGY